MGAGINSILAHGVEPIHIDPFAAQAKALQLGEYYAKQNLQKQQTEEARLKNVDTQRGIDAEAALSQAIAQNTIQDPQSGKPVVNHDAVAQQVAASGFPARADAYNIQRRADEKSAIDNQKNQVEIAQKQNGVVGNALQSLTQVPDDQLADAYDAQRQQLMKSIGPQVGDHIPPAAFLISKGGVNALKGFVAQQGAAVVDADKQITAHQKDLDYALNLNKFHQEVLKDAPDTNEKWLKQAAQVMGSAETDAQWAAGRNNLESAGAPASVLGTFGQQFTPDAVAAAQRLAVPVKEQPAFEISQNKAKSLSNMGDADWQKAVGDVVTDTKSPLYQRTLQEVNFYRKQGDLQKADDAIRKAGQQIGATEQALATEKATTPLKIAQAVATQKAMSAGQNSAVSNVPPHLISAASTAYNKSGEAFAAAQGASEEVQKVLNLAESGNKAAGANAPLVGVGAVNAVNGIKRINSAEIHQYGTAGSLLDKIQGKLQGWTEGQPIPKDVLEDMKSLHSELAKGAETKHQREVQTINQTYGANFQPMKFDSEAAGSSDKIRVKRKADGKTGTLDPKDYDPAKYDKL